MLSDEKLRQMRLDARHSPEAEHTVWWMLLARAVERAAYAKAEKRCRDISNACDATGADVAAATASVCADAIRALGGQR